MKDTLILLFSLLSAIGSVYNAFWIQHRWYKDYKKEKKYKGGINEHTRTKKKNIW